MDYSAKHFVSIAGRVYTPGEIINRPIPQEKLGRLLEKGAVAPLSPAPWGGEAAGLPEDEARESGAQDGIQEEAPEIDVMDGVIAAPPSPTASAKRRKGEKA